MKRLVLLGLGDVTTRLVIPALGQLAVAGELPDDFTVIGVAREDRSTAWLRDEVDRALRDSDEIDRSAVEGLADRFEFHRADATDADELAGVVADGEPALVYLALPAAVFADAIDAVIAVGVPDGSRLMVEKPFGNSAASAEALNEQIHRCFDEDDVVRVDHFLGLRTAHALVAARFANRVLEPVWGHGHVARVEVVWDETLALEGRAGYYDGTGAARDMVQNHLLQLLCLVAMEPPASLGHDDLADRKVDVLRAIRPWSDDPAACSRRARYGAGRVGDEDVPAYVDEEGVDSEAETETFAEVVVAVDVPRWEGVPFTLRSGKALAADRHEIAVHFRPCEHVAFASTSADDVNVLRFAVEPDEVALRLRLSNADRPDEVTGRELAHRFPTAPLGAYAMLLRDALFGDGGIAVRDDEVVAQWQAIEPFLDAWTDGRVPMEEYPAGSDGLRR